MAKPSFIKDSLSIFFTKIFVISLAIISVVILARALGPENRGILAAVLIYPQLLISLTEGGMRQAATLYIGKQKASDGEVLASLIFYVLAAGSLGYLMVLSIMWLTRPDHFSLSMMLIAAAIIPTTLSVNAFRGYFLGKQKIKSFNRSTWIERALYVGLLVTLYLLDSLTVTTAIIATTLAATFNAIQAWLYVKRINDSTLRLDLSITWAMFKTGMVYAVALFLITANYKIDVLLLSWLSTPEQVGFYAVSSQVAELMWQLPGAVMLVLMSRSANNRDDSKEWTQRVALVCRLMILISIIFAAFLSFASYYGTSLIFGNDYSDIKLLTATLLVASIFMVPFKTLNADLAGEGKPIYSIYTMLPTVILNIFLNMLLIKEYGAMGAAIATLTSYLLCSCLIISIYRNHKNIQLGKLLVPSLSDFRQLIDSVRNRRKKSNE